MAESSCRGRGHFHAREGGGRARDAEPGAPLSGTLSVAPVRARCIPKRDTRSPRLRFAPFEHSLLYCLCPRGSLYEPIAEARKPPHAVIASAVKQSLRTRITASTPEQSRKVSLLT